MNNYPKKKKALGQHFLRKQSVVDNMIDKVEVGKDTSVMEIGCGDGFLTRAILSQTPCKELLCYEIDPEWAKHVREKVADRRLEIVLENFLDAKLELLEGSWTLLANLPYQVTFPIMFKLRKHKTLFSEGVIMVQEEVAQKFVAKRGRSYNVTSIFLQHHFHMELMEKIEPEAFSPPPKVNSRLVYLKPKLKPVEVPDEDRFWKFLKTLFLQPRRTLRNNFKSTHYDISKLDKEVVSKRAQELSFEDFVNVWNLIR